MNMFPPIRRFLCAALMAFGVLPAARAQWLTQTVTLRPGWNAVYLHVDATHDSLENLVGVASPITEIWLWQENLADGRLFGNPLQPVAGSDWLPWSKATGPANAFPLRANTTYLVQNASSAEYAWNIKGKPVPPSVRWSAGGLNFFGFSTRSDSPPLFANFLSPAPSWNNFVLYHYPGGESAGASPVTAPLVSLATVPVTRGRAVWIKRQDNSDNRYFGPFETVLQDYRGVVFSDSLGAYSLRLRNHLAISNTVGVTLVASETSPTGASIPVPPLLLRTGLDRTTLTYSFASLALQQTVSFALAPKGRPGSEVEIVLGLDRASMVAGAGTEFGAVLRLQDTTSGHLQVDLPVTARQSSDEGLWVGDASITHVGNYLRTYAKATNAVEFAARSAEYAALNEGMQTVDFTGASWVARGVAFGEVTEAAQAKPWTAIVSSSDGRRLVAATETGRIYTSQDGGDGWIARADLGGWVSLASSADGINLVAVVSGGQIHTSTDGGVSWIARDSARGWVSVASSADGSRLVAAVFGGQIFTSSNAGANWTARESARSWNSVASAADGIKLVAAVQGGQLYTSTNSGAAWTPQDSDRAWEAVASSQDGVHLAAAVSGGQLYVSGDSGSTWSPRDSDRPWASIATSADGTHLVAAAAGGKIYASSDSGANWVAHESDREWVALASSADGLRVFAAAYDGFLYRSADAAATWAIGYPSLSCVASSADGTRLLAGIRGGHLFASTNAGAAWAPLANSPVTNWQAVASSVDGSRLVAAVQGGQIYTSPDAGTNWFARAGAPSARWLGVASSADGLGLVAVADGGDVFTSADGGVVWNRRVPAPGSSWRAVATSAGGERLLAAAGGGRLYASTNSGVTWSPLFGASGTNWQAVASSADGRKLVAVENPGGVHVSTDFGVSWEVKAGVPPMAAWSSVACSTNGNALVAVLNGGLVYTSGDSGRSWTASESNRLWTAVASSSDGTRLVASTGGPGGSLYSTVGQLVTPPLVYDTETTRVLSGGRRFLTASFDTELGAVPTPFPLRLIVHKGSDGTTRLLQRVFVGPDAVTTNVILTLDEKNLHPGFLAQARRLSAVHLPLSKVGWDLEGDFGGVGILNAVLKEGHDDTGSNPFLHAYHPDHDNLDALFQSELKRGQESYGIRRQITLSFVPPGDDFSSRVAGSARVRGTYLENIVLEGGDNQTRTVVTKGTFVLNRVSSIGTLQ